MSYKDIEFSFKRLFDARFSCICGSAYKYSKSLKRHQQICSYLNPHNQENTPICDELKLTEAPKDVLQSSTEGFEENMQFGSDCEYDTDLIYDSDQQEQDLDAASSDEEIKQEAQ